MASVLNLVIEAAGEKCVAEEKSVIIAASQNFFMTFSYRILLVDDDPAPRETGAAILAASGYEVETAADGFAALVQLRKSLPDLIISDLRMPNMSGFELLSIVRRRFPQIAVIAMSGEFSGITPEGLISDAFFTKAHYEPEELFAKIADLLRRAPLRPQIAKPDKAPVWIPTNDTGYVVVTCTECLRSFSVPACEAATTEVKEAECVFCNSPNRYLCDSRSTPVKKPSGERRRLG